MQEKLLVPKQWELPEEIRARLGDEAGRQRAMTHDGHLLLVLHSPPSAEHDCREGRLFWRSPEGKWSAKEMRHGEPPVSSLLSEYEKLLDEMDEQEDRAAGSSGYFDLLTRLNPVTRSARNLHQAMQQAREALPNVRELIVLRDRAYSIARRAELLNADAKNMLDFVIARRAEEQAATSARHARSAHRLNVLAALTFPLLTMCAIFGTNLKNGLEGWDSGSTPLPLIAIVGAGLALGAILTGYVTRK